MALTFICGRAKSGKSKYIYDSIRELCSKGKEVMLIGQNCHGLSALMHLPIWCPYGV
jgi:tRNA A37 methylthiotransferase MiaB